MRVPRKQDEKFSLNVGKADCVVNVASEIRHRCHDYDTESYPRMCIIHPSPFPWIEYAAVNTM